jgi:DNA repair exonuclease SbcCD ATPase subunit
MEAFAAVNGHTELSSSDSPSDVLLPVAAAEDVSGETESIESLRATLRSTERRLAYFERFGSWVEEQMAAVVERAASLERDSERQRTEVTEDIARLRAEVDEEVASIRRDAERERKEVAAEIARRRQELGELKTECDRRREEAQATVAHAHKTAELVMDRLSGSAAGVVQRALADLETLRSELTPEGLAATAATVPVPETPDPADHEVGDGTGSADDHRRGWLPFGK